MQVVGVGIAGNIEHGNVGQGRSATQRFAGACDDAFTFELGQHGLKGTPQIAAYAEDLGQVALALDVLLLRQRLE